MNEILLRKVAISLIPKAGPKLVRRLIAYLGSIEAVFRERHKAIRKIPGLNPDLFNEKILQNALKQAEAEILFMEKNKIKCLFYLDKNYPPQLKECEDSPVCLFVKGNSELMAPKVVSVVGTRKSTAYGRELTSELIKMLALHDEEIMIVSGLAYGIDITAHKTALEAGLKTIAVLGHGLNTIYPASHGRYVKSIFNQGALVTEFASSKKPDPGNFVSRNRIIAGLAHATVIVESANKGGALLTADMANSYNREVFAFPGRVSDLYSGGCNKLIRNNEAILIESGEDLINSMLWMTKRKNTEIQPRLFDMDLTPDEHQLINLLKESGSLSIDEMRLLSDLSPGVMSSTLLGLEFAGLITTLPGKIYKLR